MDPMTEILEDIKHDAELDLKIEKLRTTVPDLNKYSSVLDCIAISCIFNSAYREIAYNPYSAIIKEFVLPHLTEILHFLEDMFYKEAPVAFGNKEPESKPEPISQLN